MGPCLDFHVYCSYDDTTSRLSVEYTSVHDVSIMSTVKIGLVRFLSQFLFLQVFFFK